MSRFPPGIRCRISGVLLLLILGNAFAARSTAHHAGGDGVPRVPVTGRGEVAALPATGPRPPFTTCTRRPVRGSDPSIADARWKRQIKRVVAGRLVGLAVGIGGRIVFAHNGAKPRVPASNQKLLLSLALFDRLGPGHRIPTRAAARAVDGETVAGDLWVIGRGDPTLTAADPGYWGDLRATTLTELAGQIGRAGVTRIEGRVMGADDYFAHDIEAPGWQAYVPGRFVPLPSSLVLNGNNAVTGTPERAVATALTRQLERIGIKVGGRPGAGKPPARLTPVAEVRARPLREIVAYMNRTSNNFFAEMLGKRVGADAFGAPGTIEKGARAIHEWVRAHGARAATNDSSGLSYTNRVSPRDVVRLLSVAVSKPWGRALRDGLPGPGEGTLRSRLHGLDVRAKTGSLFNGASSLSGWVRSTGTRRWVEFSILGGGVPKGIEDRVVRIIARASIRVPARPPVHACGRSPETSGRTSQASSATHASRTRIRWRRSTAIGTHAAGRLVNGVGLPAEGRHFFTWDPVEKRSPNRAYRRVGTDRLIRVVVRVLKAHRAQHAGAPRVGIGDISRPNGGDFGRQFGGRGHVSHQNGLDVDLYYPRRDRRERAPRTPGQIDRALAQDLVDRFVRAGAEFVFVGPSTGLTGPPGIVQPLVNHDDHMHVRLPLP